MLQCRVKKDSFLHRELWRVGFGVKKGVFLHKKLLPGKFSAQDGHFLHKKNCREEDFPPDS